MNFQVTAHEAQEKVFNTLTSLVQTLTTVSDKDVNNIKTKIINPYLSVLESSYIKNNAQDLLPIDRQKLDGIYKKYHNQFSEVLLQFLMDYKVKFLKEDNRSKIGLINELINKLLPQQQPISKTLMTSAQRQRAQE